ncbi:S8 family peptidase [Rubellimicrobium aerolatum]|uniref:S8 family serine peptidase n=1 Tax=Rubellimicrobium aerolatum TaxID=490979 RepID=A0ABW0SA74_9RHOB|nr:S8 family serine peptidase [Rubellimicrobium aerolatum]MBP1805212.1 subtilisin family serine protease [Rubellimicrobium aerolatum]
MATSREDRRRTLRHQVEAILDRGHGPLREVILQAAPPPGAEGALHRRAAESLRLRALAASPRDLLPIAPPVAIPVREPARALQPALAGPRPDRLPDPARPPLPALRAARLAALGPVLRSDLVRHAAGKPRAFWAADALLLRLAEADLMALPRDDLADRLEGVFPNRRLPLPPHVAARPAPGGDDDGIGAWGLRAVGALGAWGAFGARGKGVRIGLLDTGVDPDHPDLRGKIAAWAEFDAEGAPVPGSRPHDSDRHGTHCAGIMVGGDAGGGWIGVAPEAEIAAALVLDGARGGTDAQVLAGIDWALDQGVDVLNLSLGGPTWGPETPSTYTSALLAALRLGVPVVTAIGNEGHQTTGSPGNDYLAFAVGAFGRDGRPAGFSGGRTQVIRASPHLPPEMLPLAYSKPDLSAPGVAVRSAVPGGGWERLNGTSMAAPHVAGAVALLLSATGIRDRVEPAERAFLLQDLLTGSAEEGGEAGQDHRFGFGRLDVLRAIGAARGLGL